MPIMEKILNVVVCIVYFAFHFQSTLLFLSHYVIQAQLAFIMFLTVFVLMYGLSGCPTGVSGCPTGCISGIVLGVGTATVVS